MTGLPIVVVIVIGARGSVVPIGFLLTTPETGGH
jgi:hypothetical protein